MTDKTLREEDLRQFTGTEGYYRHALVPNITYTDGVQYVAETGGAYWLVDEIALANAHEPKVMAEEFQEWKLVKNAEGNGAILSCSDGGKDGHKSKVVYFKTIEFTDFPLSEIKIYVSNNTILLPSEW